MIDPDSIKTPASRRSEPGPLRSESINAINFDLEINSLAGSRVDVSTSTNDKDSEKLAMDPTDLRVIRRLSDRVNVLPVVARADVLTDEKLSAVKAAIRRDLHESKLEFGVDESVSKRSVQGHTVDNSLNTLNRPHSYFFRIYI